MLFECRLVPTQRGWKLAPYGEPSAKLRTGQRPTGVLHFMGSFPPDISPSATWDACGSRSISVDGLRGHYGEIYLLCGNPPIKGASETGAGGYQTVGGST